MASENHKIEIELRKLSNLDLNAKVKNLAAYERKLTQSILQHLAEVDRRRLYLQMAYSSFYEYLIKEIGYSEGAAQRRIDAARLLQNVPELSQKIETGAIKLSQVSHMQKMCRHAKKSLGTSVTTETRKEILLQLENKNSQKTQIIVAKALNLPIKTDELAKTDVFPINPSTAKIIYQADESVRVEMWLSKKEQDLVQQARQILSNKTGGGMKDTFIELAKRLIADQSKDLQKTKPITQPKDKSKARSNSDASIDVISMHESEVVSNPNATATVAVDRNLKTITLKLRSEITRRDQCCQFKNKDTGKICGSKYFLEVDHIQPKFANGSNSPANLRLLCRNHNQYRYQASL